MKARDLIEALQRLDPEVVVTAYSDDGSGPWPINYVGPGSATDEAMVKS